MALATLGNLDVLEAVVRMPPRGPWTIEAQLQTGTAPTGRVVFKTPGMALSGLASGGIFVERNFFRLSAGAGGLAKTVAARGYKDVEVRTALGDALRAAGETLSSTSAAATLGKRLAFWTRLGRPLNSELSALADAVGASWRTLDDGSVWFGVDTWPAVTIEHRVMAERPDLKRAEIASDEPTLRPGVAFSGRRVTWVEHWFRETETRTVYGYV